MRKRWWRFGWHPSIGALPGTVTLWLDSERYEEWAPIAFGLWWLRARPAPVTPEDRR